MGHTVFLSDGAEYKNYITYNVVAGTRPSFSLLNTDQTPGSFWITNPDNTIVGNRAAGSTDFGFWFNLGGSTKGAAFDPNIVPGEAKLGEFRNNVAHSNGDHGLLVWPGHWPKPEQAYYNDFIAYQNKQDGVFMGSIGTVILRNITVADNGLYGIEVFRLNQLVEGRVLFCIKQGHFSGWRDLGYNIQYNLQFSFYGLFIFNLHET